jgi:hypothetical protein
LHYEGYKSTISSYGKEEKAFNFESKVTLEKLLHIEFSSPWKTFVRPLVFHLGGIIFIVWATPLMKFLRLGETYILT